MSASLEQLLSLQSRATDACLHYLDRVIDALGQQPLLAHFGRSLDLQGLRRPLWVEPYDAARLRDRLAQEERERENVCTRSSDPDAERRLYAHRSGMDDEERKERAQPEALDPLLDTLEVAMVLGDPGGGKSECLKGLAVRVAKSIHTDLLTAMKLPDEVRLPVFAELPEVARLFGETETKTGLLAFVRDLLMPQAPGGRASRKLPSLDNHTLLLAAILKAAIIRLNMTETSGDSACGGALRHIWRDWTQPHPPGSPHPLGSLVMLDAWDEVAENHRTTEFKRALHVLSVRPPFRLVATSRVIGFEDGVLDASPHLGSGSVRRTLVILPFRDEQATAFIRAFFPDGTTAAQLVQDLSTKPMVMGMIQNPLLATLICLAFDPSAPQPVALPARRAQVYQAVVNRLLGDAEALRKSGVKLKAEVALQIQGILRSLAFHFFPDEVFSEAKVAEFCEKHRPRPGTALARHLRDSRQTLFDCLLGSGMLARHGAGGLRFLHLTLQEFFAAGCLARAVEQQGWENAAVPVRGLPRPVKVSVLVDKKGWHPRWREVIALTAGQLDPVDAPVEPLLETLMACQDSIHHHRLCLAALCLAEAREFDRSASGAGARIGLAACNAWLSTRGQDWSRRDEVCADKNLFAHLVQAAVPVGNHPDFIAWAASFLRCSSTPEYQIDALLEQVREHRPLHQSGTILDAVLEVLKQRSHSEDMRWAASKALRSFGERACNEQFLETMEALLEHPSSDDRVIKSERQTLLEICKAVTPMSDFRVGITSDINLAQWLGVSPLARSDEIAKMLLAVLRDKAAHANRRWRAAVVICNYPLFISQAQVLDALMQIPADESESETLRRKIVIAFRSIQDTRAKSGIRPVVSALASDPTIGGDLRESAAITLNYVQHPPSYTRSDFEEDERASALLRQSIRECIESPSPSHQLLGRILRAVNRLGWEGNSPEVVKALDVIFKNSSSSDDMKMKAVLIRRAIGAPFSQDQETELLKTVLHRAARRGDMSSATSEFITEYDFAQHDEVTSALEAILRTSSTRGYIRATAAAGLRRFIHGSARHTVLDALAQTPRDGFEWLILGKHETLRWFDQGENKCFRHYSVQELGALPSTAQPQV